MDIFDDTSTSELAVKINQIFESLGLRRTDCQDVPDPSHLRHKVMRFEGVIDLDSELVFNLEWRIKHVSKWNYVSLWYS